MDQFMVSLPARAEIVLTKYRIRLLSAADTEALFKAKAIFIENEFLTGLTIFASSNKMPTDAERISPFGANPFTCRV
jgi:hypothetical protein